MWCYCGKKFWLIFIQYLDFISKLPLTFLCPHFLYKLYHWKWQVTISFRVAWLCDNVTRRCELSQKTFQIKIEKKLILPHCIELQDCNSTVQKCTFQSLNWMIKTFREIFFAQAFLYVFCCRIPCMLKVKLTPKVTSFSSLKSTLLHTIVLIDPKSISYSSIIYPRNSEPWIGNRAIFSKNISI